VLDSEEEAESELGEEATLNEAEELEDTTTLDDKLEGATELDEIKEGEGVASQDTPVYAKYW
jgi:hypothetical protein